MKRYREKRKILEWKMPHERPRVCQSAAPDVYPISCILLNHQMMYTRWQLLQEGYLDPNTESNPTTQSSWADGWHGL